MITSAWRVTILTAIACALLLLIGYYPTRTLAGAAGVRAMGMAQGTVLAVVLLTLLPAIRRIPAAAPDERLRLAFKAAAVRFALALLASAALALRAKVPPAVLLTWVGITYVVLVHVETICLVLWMRNLERPR